jgi:hypothetical protein
MKKSCAAYRERRFMRHPTSLADVRRCQPFLKSISDYLGDPLDYTYAAVACGAAFRFVWNTRDWDGGNVNELRTYDDEAIKPLKLGVTALGREFKALWRSDETEWSGSPTGAAPAAKEEIKAFIREQIDTGKPLIAVGPISPPVAGIITGYKDGGDTLLGWHFFQDGSAADQQDGYFVVSDDWWEKSIRNDFHAVISLGEITAPRFTPKRIIENGIAAMEGRVHGGYAKGIAGYDAWKTAIVSADESFFTVSVVPAMDIGAWPLSAGTYDPALDKAGIPGGAKLYGLFGDDYKMYSLNKVTGAERVDTLAELSDGKYCVFRASTFDYAAVMSDKPVEVAAQFASNNPDVMMCQSDAAEYTDDVRKRACRWFNELANENPGEPLFPQIAEQFDRVSKRRL